MPRSLIAFFVVAFCFSVDGRTESAKERFAGMFNRSEYKKLLGELREAEKQDPAAFKSSDFDYLLARTAEKYGKFSTAVSYYQLVAARKGALRPYALKHLSRLMRETGNLGAERLFLIELQFSTQGGIPKRHAHQRLVRNHFESADYRAVIAAVDRGMPYMGEAAVAADYRELQVLLGKAFVRNGEAGKALQVFSRLIDSAPDKRQPDDYSLEAVRGLDRIETGVSRIESVKNLTAEAHKQRGDIYHFNRDFAYARLHYKAIVENHKGNSMIPEAMYQIGRGYVQERMYSEALPWFEGIKDEDSGDKLKGPALYAAAGVYANLDKHSEAIAAYEQFITENPDASNIERGYLNIIDAYRDAGDNKKALEWCSKTVGAFGGKKGEAAGLFAEVRIHIAAGDWNRALAALNRFKELKDLGGIQIAGGTNREEVAFLRGLMLEKLGRTVESIDVYISIEDGSKEYYGWRAMERLKTLAEEPENTRIIESKLVRLKANNGILVGEALEAQLRDIHRMEFVLRPESRSPDTEQALDSEVPKLKAIPLAKDSPVSRALFELGLYDEAAPEIETALRKADKPESEGLSDFDDDTAFTLATYYAEGGYADRAIKFIESKWKNADRQIPIENIPNEQLALLYPAPYRDTLLKFGKQNNVDPRFLLSIMRQESRFQADIKSAAAARGLMQFITNTSEKLALDLGLERFRQDELYDPETAVRFGSRYISNIFKDFPGQPQAVAASYNGGEDRMARWLKRSNTKDPDQYVPEIVFSQTKDYVHKVMANYRMYRKLYDENLEPVRSRKKQ